MMKYTELRFLLMLFGVAALTAASLLSAQPAHAANIPVTNTLDAGAGSLRQVVIDAADGDTIVFDSSVFSVPLTITLFSGQIEITKVLSIDGAYGGIVTPTLDGNNASRILLFKAYDYKSVSHLRIINGYCGSYDYSCTGAGINSNGVLTVNDTIFENNHSLSMGGALGSNYGALYVNRCMFVNNTSYYGGGGIYINSDRYWPSTIDNSIFIANSGSDGGGFLNFGFASINDSQFYSNIGADGGGIENYGVLTVTSSLFVNNTAISRGGGIYNEDWLVVVNSIFRSNSAAMQGGGIGSFDHLFVFGSEFDGNQAQEGGGLWSGVRMDISDVTIHGNHAITGGAIQSNFSTFNMTNTTVYSNTATRFGGIANDGYLNAVNSTLVGNGAGDIGILTGGSARFINSIISTCSNNSSKRIVDGGHNIDAGNTCGFTSATSLTNTNPLLGALGFHEGLVPTLPLLIGSPAIDAGDDTACPATDARGIHRPIGPHCDIGAYEALHRYWWMPVMRRE